MTAGESLPVGAFLRLNAPTQKRAKELTQDIKAGHSIEVNPAQDVYALVGAALSVENLPQVQPEIAVRYGVWHRLDLGFRTTGQTWRGEVWGQIYDSPGFRVAGGLGGDYRHFDQGVAGVLSQLSLLDFSQFDIDATVLGGWNWKYGAVYFGPKAVYSGYPTSGSLAHASNLDVNVLGFDLKSSIGPQINMSASWLVGGVVGFRVRWKHFYATGELGIYQSIYNPSFFGQVVKLSGLVLYPAGGVGAEF